jgi:hypothetical protein
MERCPHCGATIIRPAKPGGFVLRYTINGARFRRHFDNATDRDTYAETLRENGITIIERKGATV